MSPVLRHPQLSPPQELHSLPHSCVPAHVLHLTLHQGIVNAASNTVMGDIRVVEKARNLYHQVGAGGTP